jgi:hypothetical protein
VPLNVPRCKGHQVGVSVHRIVLLPALQLLSGALVVAGSAEGLGEEGFK